MNSPGPDATALATLQTGSGLVSLVGAGPGDPELLTVRAARALEQADYVLHDRLVAPAILDLAKPETPREYVGKDRGDNHRQAAINARLIELAHRYGRVVRLKGGDPFVFGRGGEEALALQQARVRYEIVPGLTAAVGCAAYAGIPLTHRGLAQQVTLVTAHHAAAGGPAWAALAGAGHTVVFYMGVAEIRTIETELLHHGRAATTPVALIENGCTATQRVFRGPLAGITALAARVGLRAPALILVGEVAGLDLTAALPIISTRPVSAAA